MKHYLFGNLHSWVFWSGSNHFWMQLMLMGTSSYRSHPDADDTAGWDAFKREVMLGLLKAGLHPTWEHFCKKIFCYVNQLYFCLPVLIGYSSIFLCAHLNSVLVKCAGLAALTTGGHCLSTDSDSKSSNSKQISLLDLNPDIHGQSLGV